MLTILSFSLVQRVYWRRWEWEILAVCWHCERAHCVQARRYVVWRHYFDCGDVISVWKLIKKKICTTTGVLVFYKVSLLMLMCLTESVRSYYNLILKKAGQFLTDLQVNLLRFALALRSYSPAVHASQQVCFDQTSIYLTIIKPSQKQLWSITGDPSPFLVRSSYVICLS